MLKFSEVRSHKIVEDIDLDLGILNNFRKVDLVNFTPDPIDINLASLRGNSNISNLTPLYESMINIIGQEQQMEEVIEKLNQSKADDEYIVNNSKDMNHENLSTISSQDQHDMI